MRVKVLLGLTLLSVMLVGCGQNDAASKETQAVAVSEAMQELSLNLNKVPKNLDPQLNREGEGSFVMNNIYEGLMRQVGDELINGMAESYTVSEDGLVYTFTLRKSYWSDGQPVTAMDFEYAWRRGSNPILESPHIKDYQAAKIKNADVIARGEMSTASLGVLALDTNILEVTLDEPNENFLEYMTLESFMPVREGLVNENGTWSKLNPVCNGPFKVANFNTGGIVLEKNENYWDVANVKLPRINVKMIKDPEKAQSKYLNNELDVLLLNLKSVDTTNMVTTSKGAVEGELEEEESSHKVENDVTPEENDILVHQWIDGWRVNKQGLLWLGNTYGIQPEDLNNIK